MPSLKLILLYQIQNYSIFPEVPKTRNKKIKSHTKVTAMPWEEKFEADKKLVEELKVEWKKMRIKSRAPPGGWHIRG